MSRSRTLGYFAALFKAIRLALTPGGPSMGARFSSLPRMFHAVRTGEYTGTTLSRLALMAAGVAYIVSPVDFLPEAMLGIFGIADDAVVFGMVVSAFVEETQNFLAWERDSRTRPAAEPGREGAADWSVHDTVRSDVVG